MALQYYELNLKLGEQELEILDSAVTYFSYQIMWDRGVRCDIVIQDPSCVIHKELEGQGGSPSIPISFLLHYKGLESSSYQNKGSTKKLYIRRLAHKATPLGPAIVIRAVDAASLLLRRDTTPFHANAKCSDFVTQYCQEAGVTAEIPGTGDTAHPHRAVQGKPISVIRYELDRVLSSGGKPITLQFDDDASAQRLVGWEELYEGATTLLEDSYSGGTFNYGLGVAENQGGPARWGQVCYDYDMSIDVAEAMWGHKVSVSHLISNHSVVEGSVEKKLASRLGIKPDTLDNSHRRLVPPRTYYDNPTLDQYYDTSMMTNAVFHSEMSMTQGYIVTDPDFKAFDSHEILNRYHLKVNVTGGSNLPTGHSVLPTESVIMGYNHVITDRTAGSRIFLRRGR